MTFIQNTFDRESIFLLILSLLLASCACLALYCEFFWLANLCIYCINIYMGLILIFAAVRSDGLQNNHSYVAPSFMRWVFPTRLVGIGVFFILAYALVKAFAALYLQLETTEHFNTSIASPEDATYFSLVTITTLGYGDFHPVSESARSAVVFQVSSGLLLLFGVFPLLISRISGFTGND